MLPQGRQELRVGSAAVSSRNNEYNEDELTIIPIPPKIASFRRPT
jgi:hypothetical protein